MTHYPLSDPQLRSWLALINTPGIGPVHFFQLLALFPECAEIFSVPRAQLSALGVSDIMIEALQKPDWDTVEKSLRWAEQPNHHIVSYYDPHYPLLLKQTTGAPVLLFVRGNVELLQTHQLAIVGSRNPTSTGRDTARHFAQNLSGAGLTITSGLAIGIDGASHNATLERQGKTVAVLGSGLDKIYPYAHTKLAEAIADQGALVSEYLIGTTPKAIYFPQRNRLVSGLSLGVLVIEATLRSGSLITARLAADQGREVFAIPGSIHNPLARGCHFLIRQGAKLVETAQDIMEELGPLANVTADANKPSATHSKNQASTKNKQYLLSKDAQALLDQIGFETTTIDQLVERTGLSGQTVISTLSLLELQDFIVTAMGGYTLKS